MLLTSVPSFIPSQRVIHRSCNRCSLPPPKKEARENDRPSQQAKDHRAIRPARSSRCQTLQLRTAATSKYHARVRRTSIAATLYSRHARTRPYCVIAYIHRYSIIGIIIRHHQRHLPAIRKGDEENRAVSPCSGLRSPLRRCYRPPAVGSIPSASEHAYGFYELEERESGGCAH